LAETTAAEKADLLSRVKELETELSVWKQAHTAAREAAERDSKARDDQQFALVKRPTSSTGSGSDGANQLVLCIIDGSRSIFSPSYLRHGQEGGRRAGHELMTGIRQHLRPQIYPEQLSIWISIYVDKAALRSDIILHDLCTPDQWDAFCSGLSEASANLAVVDVAGKATLDAKIKEYVQTFATLPQTTHVFFGGMNPPIIYRAFNRLTGLPIAGYSADTLSIFFTLNASLSTKLVMIYGQPPPPTLSPRLQAKSYSLPSENPPPCNEHYLLEKCSKEGRCKYSHEYELSAEHLETLAKNAKQSPCWFLNNEKQCPYGKECCWGHVCPFGVKCYFSSKDRCRFKGRQFLFLTLFSHVPRAHRLSISWDASTERRNAGIGVA
ncbi:uncharacterized protein STEHIDRAFT_54771, partial [Stereum hirsutum FP-91666 SS1]|uniref:uncharacterized protein n=1 Tax=Stereum hirsutum (strain FP-91666) TaxID=721885 RepID=UPI000440BBFD